MWTEQEKEILENLIPDFQVENPFGECTQTEIDEFLELVKAELEWYEVPGRYELDFQARNSYRLSKK